MEDLETKLVDLLGKLEDAAVEISPEIVELGAIAVFWDGAIQIFMAAFLLVVSLTCFRFAVSNFKAGSEIKTERADRWRDDMEVPHCIGALLLFFVATMCAFIGAVELFQDNPWLKMFSPEAALVKQFFLG